MKYINVTLFKTGNLVHIGPRHQSQTSPLLVHPASQVYLLGYPAPVRLLEWHGWDSLVGLQQWACWYGLWGWSWVVSLGISWMQRYSLLSSTSSSSHTGLSRSAVGRGSLSSSESVSGIGGGISLKARN